MKNEETAAEVVEEAPVKKARKPKVVDKPPEAARKGGGRPPKGKDAYELPRTSPWHNVLDASPSRAALAAHLKTTPQAIYSALLAESKGKPTRADWVLALSAIGGLTPAAFRKDLYLKEWSVPPYSISESGNKTKAKAKAAAKPPA